MGALATQSLSNGKLLLLREASSEWGGLEKETLLVNWWTALEVMGQVLCSEVAVGLNTFGVIIDTKSLHGLETEYLSVLLYSAYLNCKLLRILFLLGTKSSARASSSLYVSDSCGHAMVNLLLQVLTRFVGLHMMPACEENYTK